MYNRMFEKYDEETAREIMEMMYGHYRRIVYLQIEDEIDPDDLEMVKKRADDMDFEMEIEPASIALYENLILGNESYPGVARLKKGDTLNLWHFKSK